MKQTFYTIFSKSLNKVLRNDVFIRYINGLQNGRWTEDLSEAKMYSTKKIAEQMLKEHKYKWSEGTDAKVFEIILIISDERKSKLERILKDGN